MSSCDNCPSKGKCGNKSGNCSRMMMKYGKVKNIIGVLSGKGGVGKSTITGILAVKLRNKGYKVGVLDADITGPSMPRFFGVNKERAYGAATDEKDVYKINPVETPLGIKVMSLNFLIEKEDQPVIWRGPVITNMLQQMYTYTDWGELDFLLIDMPPGTGDIALTVMQSLPVNGMIIVSTPQDMVSMIVKKVITMCERLNVEVIGAVENMSYVKCPDCGRKIRLFGKTSPEEHAAYLGVPFISEMPLNVELAEAVESGDAEKYITENKEYEEIYEGFKSDYKMGFI